MSRQSSPPRHLSYDFLQEITNGFSKERVLGSGKYGTVYLGLNKDGEKMAVKVLTSFPDNDELFDKEFYNLAYLQHPNIVRFVGYCHQTHRECVPYNGKLVLAEMPKKALCFEYMRNGSLDNFLFDESHGHDWHNRYTIIKGICMGLKYLHEELEHPIFHLDLKPANVLLDDDMVPRIADFGLSRFLGEEQTYMTTSPIGTFGYLPPEFINQQVISNKLDIFSLGVIIIKIMTGPMGYTRSAEMSSQEFIDHVHANWRIRLNATSIDALEPYCTQVRRCTEIALSCVEPDRRKRPTIGDIINELNNTETISKFPDAVRNDLGSSMDQESQQSQITKVEENRENEMPNDAGNLFGEVVDDYKLDHMARYMGRPKTQEDRAREALILVNEENKKSKASTYVDSLISLDGMLMGTQCLVYNATGETIYYVAKHNWLGDSGSAPYPTKIGNGQWAAFRHARTSTSIGSIAAVVYCGKSKDGEDQDYLLAWRVTWMQGRAAYFEPYKGPSFSSVEPSIGLKQYRPQLGPGPVSFHSSPGLDSTMWPSYSEKGVNIFSLQLLSSPTWCKDYMPIFSPAPRPAHLLPLTSNRSTWPGYLQPENMGYQEYRPLLGLAPTQMPQPRDAPMQMLVYPNKAYCDIGVVNYFQTRMPDVYRKLVLSNYSWIAKSDGCEIEATIGKGQLPTFTAIIRSRT